MKIFHHADLDGEASAASLLFSKPFREMAAGSVGIIPANYNIPFPIDTIDVNEEIFILDFCLQEPGMWERLLSVTDHGASPGRREEPCGLHLSHPDVGNQDRVEGWKLT